MALRNRIKNVFLACFKKNKEKDWDTEVSYSGSTVATGGISYDEKKIPFTEVEFKLDPELQRKIGDPVGFGFGEVLSSYLIHRDENSIPKTKFRINYTSESLIYSISCSNEFLCILKEAINKFDKSTYFKAFESFFKILQEGEDEQGKLKEYLNFELFDVSTAIHHEHDFKVAGWDKTDESFSRKIFLPNSIKLVQGSLDSFVSGTFAASLPARGKSPYKASAKVTDTGDGYKVIELVVTKKPKVELGNS